MKKILTSLALVASGLAFAQVGINAGKTTEGYSHDLAPDAVFHVENGKDENGKDENKGVLLPKVSLSSKTDQETTSKGNVSKGLMVWNTGDGGLKPAGYYYWDGSQWILTGNVGGTTAKNIYSANGNLSENRTVTQDNHDMTYNTGDKGKFIIEGTSKLGGASYVKTRVLDSGNKYTVDSDGTDYYISVASTQAGGQFNLYVPEASSTNEGRVLIITNRTAKTNIKLLVEGSDNQIINGSQAEVIPPNKGEWIISDGKKWFNLINY